MTKHFEDDGMAAAEWSNQMTVYDLTESCAEKDLEIEKLEQEVKALQDKIGNILAGDLTPEEYHKLTQSNFVKDILLEAANTLSQDGWNTSHGDYILVTDLEEFAKHCGSQE